MRKRETERDEEKKIVKEKEKGRYFFVVLSSGRHHKLHLEIHCLALDGFDLNTVHKLSSKKM